MTRSNSSELPCVLDECFTKTTLPANNVGMAIRVSCQIGKFHGIIARIGPSVQIVTRDRSPTFAEAIRRGAPHALHEASLYWLLGSSVLKNQRFGCGSLTSIISERLRS